MSERFNPYYIILQGIILLTFCVNSHATTYYVATNGNDNNPGSTEDKPFRTLQKVADLVKAGDLVLVKQGTYAGFHIKAKDGRADAWIVFKPYPGHKVVLDSYINNYANTWRAVEISGSSYLEINGFEITDSNPLYDSNLPEDYARGDYHNGLKFNGAYGSYGDPSHIRIINNHFYHTGDNAILGDGLHVEIINNYIHHVGLNRGGYGVYVGGDELLIRGNVIHNASGFALHLYPVINRSLVENNLLYDNGSMNLRFGSQTKKRSGDGIIVGGGSGNIVRNNVCYNNIDWGIRVGGNNNLIANNTFYNNGLQGIYVYDGTSNVIRNNIAYQNRGEEGYPGDSYIGRGSTQDHNLFSIDPKFVNAARGDFHLQAGSPAIDAGISIPGFNNDFDGTPRPQQGGWDIGAYEFGGSPSLTAYINANPTSGPAPLAVNFSGNASGGKAPYSFSWDLGDGKTSVLQNPAHTYERADFYTATLTVTDGENKRATATQAITAKNSATYVPSVRNIKATEVAQSAELPAISKEKWFDLYLYLDDPQGWDDVSYAEIWLNHESNLEGTLANRGGRFFAASNYVMSYSVEVGRIWAKETEGTTNWTNLTGQLGKYVDDDNDEYEQNSAEQWAKARVKLLPDALNGNWTMNAYVIDKARNQSNLFQKKFVVSSAASLPEAFITLSDPSPTKAGTVQVSLTTSKIVTKIPTPLIFNESDKSTTTINLSGPIPGNIFTGVFVVDDKVADGVGHFTLPVGALVDENGIKGNAIKSGAYVKIDQTPPAIPQNVKVSNDWPKI